MKNIKKIIMFFGAVAITLMMVSSATVLATPQPNERPDFQKNLMKRLLLKYYKIDMDKTTIGEFKQILYTLASKSNSRDEASATELKNDVDGFYAVINQIGVTQEMTITQAKTVIDNAGGVNELGYNIICFVGVSGCGITIPVFRVIHAIYGFWALSCDTLGGQATVTGLLGTQHQEVSAIGGFGGTVLGLIGTINMVTTVYNPPPGLPRLPCVTVLGIALYSHMLQNT